MKGVVRELQDALDEIKEWRHHLHAHPETAFEEHATSDYVADKLAGFGLEVHRGVGRTGVVAVLRNGDGPAIGLRADMDALHIEESTNLPWRSRHSGRMHACGHDGHTTMLLAAARHLARTRAFSGTAVFIFQPAEEHEGGGRAMVQDGLFRRFPVDAVYGMHNWPGMPVGRIAVKAGPMMAATASLEIVVRGKGCHAAMPHMGSDAVVAAAQVISALQTIPARNVHPVDSAVVSVTQVHGGEAWNIIPAEVVLRGTIRTFRDEVQRLVERRVRDIAGGVTMALGCEAEVRIDDGYPATVNTEAEAAHARRVAALVVGEENVDAHPVPSMGAEDFSFMLKERPGCYIWVGNGAGEDGKVLHSPHYDFNDAAIPIGASYWVRLVETLLPTAATPA